MNPFEKYRTQKSLWATYLKTGLRFAQYFFELSRQYEHDYARLDREWENAYRAIGLFDRAGDKMAVVELVQILNDFLEYRGYWEELIAAIDFAIDAADRQSFTAKPEQMPEVNLARVKLRSLLINIHVQQGDYRESERIGKEALRLARQIKHKKLEALMLGHLGTVAQVQGNRGEAEQLLLESKGLLEKLDNRRGVGQAFHRLAILAQARGQWSQAQKYEEERLQIARELGADQEIARTLYDLGELIAQQGHDAAALGYYQESHGLSTQLGDQEMVAEIVGRIHALETAPVSGQDFLRQAVDRLDLERQNGNRAAILDAMQGLAQELKENGQTQAAFQQYEQALQLASELGQIISRAFILQGMGEILEQGDQEDAAMQYYNQALDAAREAGHLGLMDVALTRLGMHALWHKDYPQAQRLLEEALVVERRWENQRWEARTLHQLGNIAYLQGKLKKANQLYRETLALSQHLGDENTAGYNRGQLGRIAFDQKDYGVAESHFLMASEAGKNTKDVHLTGLALQSLLELYRKMGDISGHRDKIESIVQFLRTMQAELLEKQSEDAEEVTSILERIGEEWLQ